MLLNRNSLLWLGKDESLESSMAGRLYARTGGGKWESRFGVLKGNLLFLFKKGLTEKQPMAMMVVEDCVVDLREEEEVGRPLAFQVNFRTAGTCYAFGADSPETLEQWVAALAVCGVDNSITAIQSARQKLSHMSSENQGSSSSSTSEAAGAP